MKNCNQNIYLKLKLESPSMLLLSVHEEVLEFHGNVTDNISVFKMVYVH